MSTFIEAHAVARALLAATAAGSVGLEWAVTARERLTGAAGAGARSGARARVALATLVETSTARTRDAAPADRRTKQILVGGMLAGIGLGWAAARLFPGANLPGGGWPYVSAGVAVMWLGILLRAWSIALLGRFFQRVVVIQAGHRVVTAGPYRVVRHPGYAGNLLAAAGLGLAFGNAAALAMLLVVPLLGHLPRIRVEEAELERSLGAPYRDYAAATPRVIPGVW